jgi:type II secretory pathway predicted ATPase ExeA
VDRWPLIGRAKELSQLTAAVITRRRAVITGSPGVGKTVLATACLQAAEDQGMSVARTTATFASRGLPFGALATFLPPDPAADRLSRDDQTEMLRRYIGAVVDRADGRPLVLFVDDAHLLDDGSATLAVSYLGHAAGDVER